MPVVQTPLLFLPSSILIKQHIDGDQGQNSRDAKANLRILLWATGIGS
jgi:hypothetical protein